MSDDLNLLDYGIEKNIKKHRAIETTVTILKSVNNPLAHQEVVIAQQNHEFLFGCTAHKTIPLVNNELAGKERVQAELFNEKLLKLFNFITLFYYIYLVIINLEIRAFYKKFFTFFFCYFF